MFRFFRKRKKRADVDVKKEKAESHTQNDVSPQLRTDTVQVTASTAAIQENNNPISKMSTNITTSVEIKDQITLKEESSSLTSQEALEYEQIPLSDEEIRASLLLEQIVEAALFAAGRPLTIEELEKETHHEANEIRRALRKIRDTLEGTALICEEIAKDRWLLYLRDEYIEIARPFAQQPILDENHMKVLTHIAYRQPVSQNIIINILSDEINPHQIRKIISSLYMNNYITIEQKSRSTLLMTADRFYEEFAFKKDQRIMKLQLIWRLKALNPQMGHLQVPIEHKTENDKKDAVDDNQENVEEKENLEELM